MSLEAIKLLRSLLDSMHYSYDLQDEFLESNGICIVCYNNKLEECECSDTEPESVESVNDSTT